MCIDAVRTVPVFPVGPGLGRRGPRRFPAIGPRCPLGSTIAVGRMATAQPLQAKGQRAPCADHVSGIGRASIRAGTLLIASLDHPAHPLVPARGHGLRDEPASGGRGFTARGTFSGSADDRSRAPCPQDRPSAPPESGTSEKNGSAERTTLHAADAVEPAPLRRRATPPTCDGSRRKPRRPSRIVRMARIRDRHRQQPGCRRYRTRSVTARRRPRTGHTSSETSVMNNIVYIVGAVVIVLFILGFLGFR